MSSSQSKRDPGLDQNSGRRRPDRPVVLSICGPAGVGKSQLSKTLVETLGAEASTRVPGDYYLMPAAERLESYFRKPLQYDWQLLARVLSAPEGTMATTPAFDFTTFQRTSTAEVRFFPIRPLLVVDAMYPYPAADIKILITTNADVRKDRIAQRDAIWGTDVVRRWRQLERSRAWLEKLNIEYDLCLSGTDDLKQNTDRIIGCMHARYAFLGRGTGGAGVQGDD